MSDSSKSGVTLPPEQQAIRDKCFHPSGAFVEFPKEDVEASIPERFEKIARMYPDRIAVEAEDESLTYEGLNRAANRLANCVLADRVGENGTVAVILPKGISQAVAIFAVLKADKIALLLDPERAPYELAHFLTDAQANLIVTNNKDEPGERSLVGYVVANESSPLSSQQIRQFLGQRLPEYMIPGAFVFLESLPLTPSGKLDHRAFPAPERHRGSDEAFAVPRTAVEKILAKIWADVLKLDEVGIHDNFFEPGGHSLLATRVVSRIREMLRIELPLRTLFAMPTIAGLSDYIEGMQWAGDENLLTIEHIPDRTEKIIL